MANTFIENYIGTKGLREKERFILKNLVVTSDAKLRKMKYGWSVTFNHGLKWYVEFSDESDEIFFDDEVAGETATYFPRFIHYYKGVKGECIKETVLSDIFESAYRTHKILKA